MSDARIRTVRRRCGRSRSVGSTNCCRTAGNRQWVSDQMSNKRTYQASCHCGAVRFRFRSEEITKGCRCNCSICVRKGIVTSAAYHLIGSRAYRGDVVVGSVSVRRQGCEPPFLPDVWYLPICDCRVGSTDICRCGQARLLPDQSGMCRGPGRLRLGHRDHRRTITLTISKSVKMSSLAA